MIGNHEVTEMIIANRFDMYETVKEAVFDMEGAPYNEANEIYIDGNEITINKPIGTKVAVIKPWTVWEYCPMDADEVMRQDYFDSVSAGMIKAICDYLMNE